MGVDVTELDRTGQATAVTVRVGDVESYEVEVGAGPLESGARVSSVGRGWLRVQPELDLEIRVDTAVLGRAAVGAAGGQVATDCGGSRGWPTAVVCCLAGSGGRGRRLAARRLLAGYVGVWRGFELPEQFGGLVFHVDFESVVQFGEPIGGRDDAGPVPSLVFGSQQPAVEQFAGGLNVEPDRQCAPRRFGLVLLELP